MTCVRMIAAVGERPLDQRGLRRGAAAPRAAAPPPSSPPPGPAPGPPPRKRPARPASRTPGARSAAPPAGAPRWCFRASPWAWCRSCMTIGAARGLEFAAVVARLGKSLSLFGMGGARARRLWWGLAVAGLALAAAPRRARVAAPLRARSGAEPRRDPRRQDGPLRLRRPRAQVVAGTFHGSATFDPDRIDGLGGRPDHRRGRAARDRPGRAGRRRPQGPGRDGRARPASTPVGFRPFASSPLRVAGAGAAGARGARPRAAGPADAARGDPPADAAGPPGGRGRHLEATGQDDAAPDRLRHHAHLQGRRGQGEGRADVVWRFHGAAR